MGESKSSRGCLTAIAVAAVIVLILVFRATYDNAARRTHATAGNHHQN
jgi:hypothetical protein